MKLQLTAFQPKLFDALKNYDRRKFSADLMAGVIVGIIAIPLAIAFGIASGVGPFEGLVTAIIGGFLISAFGGSDVQIGGPTGAFIIIIYGVIQQFGMAGLVVATVMAGIMLVLMGVYKLGGIIKFVPYPVIIGFTGGIALTIFSTQMNDFFGLGIKEVPAGFIEKWGCYIKNFGNLDIWSTMIGVVSLLIIFLMPKISMKIPGSLAAILIMTPVSMLLVEYAGVDSVSTIGDLYKLPTGFPMPDLSRFAIPEGGIMPMIRTLLPVAFSIAILCAIESLLSAMVADGAIGARHDSNTELVGQGIANIVVPFFGGIPCTGAIARTMANINNGGRTPVAGLVHAVVLLLVLLVLGQYVELIPMPTLAAVLIVVAYNMSGWRSFVALWRNPRLDFAILIATFLLTVIFDLTIAIEIGLLMAAVSFLKRASESTVIRSFTKEIDPNKETDIAIASDETLLIPEGVEVYEIDGPYFFGIANRFEEMMSKMRSAKVKVRIIRMRRVPFIDSTGIHNLESLCLTSRREGIQVVLSGVNEDVHKTLERAGFPELLGSENICSHINIALERANELVVEKE